MTFLRFIFPYILILLVVGGMEEIIYKQSAETLKQETVRVQMGMLENSRQMVDNILKNVEDKAVEFSMSPKYRATLLLADNQKDNFYSYVDIWDTFRNANLNSNYIFDYVMYFDAPQFLITTGNMTLNPTDYYQNLMSYGDLSYSQWQELLKKADRQGRYYPAVEVLLHEERARVIPYMRLLPFDFVHPKAVLQVYIRESYIKDVFSDYVLDNHGTVLILNSSGDVITSHGDAETWNDVSLLPEMNDSDSYIYLERQKGEKWGDYLVYVKSSETDWTYVSILPEENVMRKVNLVKQCVLSVTLLAVMAILAVSFYSTTKNVRSVRQIVKKVQGFGNHGKRFTDDYSAINSNLNSLLESHDRLTVNFQKQVARVINNVVMDLIQGKYANKEETVETLEEMGFQVNRQNYCVAAMKIARLEEPYLQKHIIKEIMEGLGENDVLVRNMRKAIDAGKAIHFMGLLGTGEMADNL